MPHRFLTSGDAHAKPPFLAGRSGPPGARLALPMTLRNPQRTKAGEGAHHSEGPLEGSATVEAGGGAGNQPSRSRNNAAAHFLKLDPTTCRRGSLPFPFAAFAAPGAGPAA